VLGFACALRHPRFARAQGPARRLSFTLAPAHEASEDRFAVRTMTKADIVDKVCEQVGGFSKKEAADLVDQVFDTMKAVLESGEKIKISGFGNFVVREKKPRPGRNPQTGQEITIDARRVLTFKPSNVLKDALNGES
jgi:integration host factor subunit alpha